MHSILKSNETNVQIQKLNHPDIKTISGHISQVGYIVFSKDGKYLATCSIKGTVIRIWDVNTFSKLQELRRGTEPATMTCICFSPSNKFLACSSTRGTIHVFKLNISNTEIASDIDWEAYVDSNSYTAPSQSTHHTKHREDTPSIEATLAQTTSLLEHLRIQIQTTDLSDEQQEVAYIMLEELTDDGYLPIDIIETCFKTISCWN